MSTRDTRKTTQTGQAFSVIARRFLARRNRVMLVPHVVTRFWERYIRVHTQDKRFAGLRPLVRKGGAHPTQCSITWDPP